MHTIPMVDLSQQYLRIKPEIDTAIEQCLRQSVFIGGSVVEEFEQHLKEYTGTKNVISCGNGTDALQIALMALNLPKGSKIIVPAFTYIAPVEVIALLGFVPVFADVDQTTFNMGVEQVQQVYTEEVKAIIAVHLFGQSCNMEPIAEFAVQHGLFLIEDNAQSFGSEKNIRRDSIITTSFFPTKNLGAYGDGGAILTNSSTLASQMRRIASHGQTQKYIHETVGINSRLDALQAAVLNVKLKYLDLYIQQRRHAAAFYHQHLKEIPSIHLPAATEGNGHTFHQYTIRTAPEQRNPLQQFLKEKNISTAIYYPLPVYRQKAYYNEKTHLPNIEYLCASVLSLPIYPEISDVQLLYICTAIKDFFQNN